MLFCFMLLHASAQAEDKAAKLNNVLHQISKVKTDLTQKERQQASVKQQLNSLKKKKTTIEVNLKKTTKNLKYQKNVLVKLNKNRAKQQLQLKEAQDKLSAQINLAYQLDRTNYLKNVFAKKNGKDSDIILAYHKYVFMARLEQMRNINKTLERLELNRNKISKETKVLKTIEGRQGQQKLELEKTKKEQDLILGSLKNKIASQNKKLKQLLIAKKNLEKLVNALNPHKFAAMSSGVRTRLCQNFVWPTKGVIVTRFGSSIEQSSWKWSGIFIRAPENQEVRAISSGSIVYADFLAGYGLLLIIDHGNGYMSLYGHNNRFLKQINAKVVAGDVISTVGKNGGEEAELYFAIRYNGKPIDPQKWCR
ncbi:MAG: peptidoglycan DD-metalloendopeptidase family protein [Gammaproteobacteria bacterium]|nr:peptidoglycan DD-metalloendopeptidase family protein [Gammaproteobacteria bacterium]